MWGMCSWMFSFLKRKAFYSWLKIFLMRETGDSFISHKWKRVEKEEKVTKYKMNSQGTIHFTGWNIIEWSWWNSLCFMWSEAHRAFWIIERCYGTFNLYLQEFSFLLISLKIGFKHIVKTLELMKRWPWEFS